MFTFDLSQLSLTAWFPIIVITGFASSSINLAIRLIGESIRDRSWRKKVESDLKLSEGFNVNIEGERQARMLRRSEAVELVNKYSIQYHYNKLSCFDIVSLIYIATSMLFLVSVAILFVASKINSALPETFLYVATALCLIFFISFIVSSFIVMVVRPHKSFDGIL